MPRKYTIEDVRNKVRELSDCELLSTEYENCSSKLKLKCKCGSIFETSFAHFLNQHQRQCPTCGNNIRAQKKKAGIAEIKRRFQSIGCVCLSDEYVNRKSKVRVLCRCGHIKEMRINTALTNNFSGLCTECSRKQSTESMTFQTSDIAALCWELGMELVSDKYESAKKPIVVRCQCGREFITCWNSIRTNGKTRCDVCTKRMSSGERRVEAWLDGHGIEYVRQKTFDGCGTNKPYRFDFFLPKDNICIEFDGQQHFKAVDFSGRLGKDIAETRLYLTAYRDAVKDAYCRSNGIGLIRVKYSEVNNIDEILSSKLIPR